MRNNIKKGYYFFAVMLTTLAGLSSRKYSQFLPAFLAENAGDALWAMMVYFGFRFLLMRNSILVSLILSVLFSFGIEFSQLYQSDWINQIRGTLIGGLILGKGYLTADLIRYTAGIGLACLLDFVLVSISANRT